MRILYFDLDGTILYESFGAVKTALTDGRFEQAVRDAKFDRLVCVGNAVKIIQLHESLGKPIDGIGMILELCPGAVKEEKWFREIVSLVEDPLRRVRCIDMGQDWWYADDLARDYFSEAGQSEIFDEHNGGRILETDPTGDGSDLLRWLRNVPS
jgi:hypothetical protein